ncbi:mechanosensitive ion channel protein MscS [Paraferrimonas haliotis]|uniref:Mechanosensitive ion channel protein MscS n=1 Tax=Paraferrimonas haliotis TaxID=2013866 RepID=A0AA37TVA5_9GAMM|nr:mechanosensitive ion channel protein MscS [Paraferrimonas haliotis]
MLPGQRFALDPSKTATTNIDAQLNELALSIERLQQRQQDLREQADDFESNTQQLQQQIAQAATMQYPSNEPVDQQLDKAHSRLTQLKQDEVQLNYELTQLSSYIDALPKLINEAQANLQQVGATIVDLSATNKESQLNRLKSDYLNQSLATLQDELAHSEQSLQLKQLRLTLLRTKIQTQDSLLEQLNRLSQKQRSSTSERAMQLVRNQRDKLQDESLRPLVEQNLRMAYQLELLSQATDQAQQEQQQMELRYQRQSLQLAKVNEQLQLMDISASYGDTLLQHLWQLENPPSTAQLEAKVSDARLYQFQYQQQNGQLQRRLEQGKFSSDEQRALLTLQGELLTELIDQYKAHLTELARLRLIYDQLAHQYDTIENLLNEHLFWVPNAMPINSFWLANLASSINWAVSASQWQELFESPKQQSTYWSWWLIVSVLFLVIHDISKARYQKLLDDHIQYVGNVSQDSFGDTFKVFIGSFAYSALLPAPVMFAGVIYTLSPSNFVQAVGVGISAVGFSFFLYRLAAQLSAEKGLLIGHFRRNPELVQQGLRLFFRFTVIALPMVGIIGFTESSDNSLLRNSLGRGVFILFSVTVWWFYLRCFRLVRSYHVEKRPDKNQKLLQRMLWALLLVFPPVCAVMAANGYFYTASQLLMQLQMSIVLALSFLMAFMLIKRWMLIEQRKIAFERAKAKRADQLAQRENQNDNSTDGIVDSFSEATDEQILDLDTISSQSLGLVRTLFVVAFLVAFVGLWTQTQAAFVSMLDGVTLWNTTSMVNGLEQSIPITLKSVLVAIIIVSLAWVIAANLPGMMELVILSRLELSPGTGFAIATVSRYTVMMLGLFIAFGSIGVEWSKLQWLIAALSVGLGFGLQEIFANFISGLIILMEKPVRIGDTVTIRELTGTVSKIQIRATTIVDWDRKEIIVPNKAFITEQLINWSLSDPITRVILNVSVARDSDPSLVEALLYQAVKESDFALDLPEPEVWFAGFGQHTQDFEVRAYAKEMGSRWPLRHDLHKKIVRRLRDNKVELAYPQLEVHVVGKGGNTMTESILKS